MEWFEDILPGDELCHVGVARRSGRYPWGSGKDPYQGMDAWYSRVTKMKKEGFTFTDEDGKTYYGENAIARAYGMSSGKYRVAKSVAYHRIKSDQQAKAKAMEDRGVPRTEIAKALGLPSESSVRSLLKSSVDARYESARACVDMLKQQVDSKGPVEVGKGVNYKLGISKSQLADALVMLDMEGYMTFPGSVSTGPGKKTNTKVLCPPGTPYKVNEHGDEVSAIAFDTKNIHFIDGVVSHDGGASFDPKWVYPQSIDSKRVQVCYKEDGGIRKDGVVEIRRNVPDLDLRGSNYAQVRILVDGTHYIKGMAVYADDLPDGVDLRFNTNKKRGTPMCGPKGDTVLKPIKKDDPNNPFGSLIKSGLANENDPDSVKAGQSYYIGKDGKKHLSAINKRAEEGDWGDWADRLSSQFLSKQSEKLIKSQLKISIENKKSEYDRIMKIDNPVIRKAMLDDFAESCDYEAVHLYGAALPRQKYQVILPLNKIKDNEIYAPNYKDGETVALVRYPHAGPFEIPVLKVNNRNKEGNSTITPKAKDAVGISSKVAEQLSGADFDGDTVMVVPCNGPGSSVRITARRPLEKLEDFDSKSYKGVPGTFKPMTKANTQNEMGKISNLITDMTLKGADLDEIADCVKHSMVVIDAEKHGLDYQRSARENHVATYKERYQAHIDPETGKVRYGSSTLISRAKAEVTVAKRQGQPITDPKTGKLIWKTADDLQYVAKRKKTDADGNVVTDKNGKPVWEIDYYKSGPKKGEPKIKTRTQKSDQMSETDDAFTLVSDMSNPKEVAYAQFANSMKALANSSRLSALDAHSQYRKKDPVMAEKYAAQVDSLNKKLAAAEANAPNERAAQIMADAYVSAVKEDNPGMDKADIKKTRQRALAQARAQTGAHRNPVEITEDEFEAIQNNAVSNNKLNSLMAYADKEVLAKMATPRNEREIKPNVVNMIRKRAAADYTIEQIAEQLGVSTATVRKYL